MGKRADLRKKRRIKRFLKQSKVEAEKRREQYKAQEQERTERLETQSDFNSPEAYTPVIGLVIAAITMIDWAALQFLNYSTIHKFGTLKSIGIYILYAFILMTVISKSIEKGWGSTLIGVSIMTAPFILIINTVFSGQHEMEISNMLLAVAFSALIVSIGTLISARKYQYNGLWIVVGYPLLCTLVFFTYSDWKTGAPSPVVLLGSALFGLVLGWKWAASRIELPRNVQTAVLNVCTAHLYAFLACVALSTNVWVILFFS